MTTPDPSQNNDAVRLQAEIDAALRDKFRAEYEEKARKKLGLIDAFSGAAGRQKKVDQLTDKMLDHDIANGRLQARAERDRRESEQLQENARNLAAEKPLLAPGQFDFIDITPELAALDATPHAPQQAFNVMIPDVPALQEMPDDQFLKYVLEGLHTYDIGTAAYREPKELELVRKGLYPKGFEQPLPLASFVEKNFKVVGETELIVRDPNVSEKMTVVYSVGQLEFIDAGIRAVQSFNATGQIDMRTREVFILEHVEELLRTAGHRLTRQYEDFCYRARQQVAMQMISFDARGPRDWTSAQPAVMTVGYNVDLSTPAPAEKTTKPKKTKQPKAPK